MPLLFCNTGWMERFQGNTAADTIKGGGSYVTINGMGHEVCNFLPHNGTLYGYVQGGGQGINITRLGADKDADRITGVTVVWTAKRPNGHTVVVGWYRDATVFRVFQKHAKAPPVQAAHDIDSYLITAGAAGGTLLPVDARVLRVPRGIKGGMGQSLVWFANDPVIAPFLKKVHALIKDETTAPPAPPSPLRGKPDQAKKVLVEKAAITTCWKYYELLGYEMTSVEKDNVGWDLEAVNGKNRLRIEVKGLSGTGRQIELSPNEYDAFAAHAADYRLAVVSDALDTAALLIVRYSTEAGDWVIDGEQDAVVTIQPKTGAVVRFG